MMATELFKRQLVGTGIRISFTFEDKRYTGRLISKDVITMSDVFEDESGELIRIPWLGPDEANKRITECEVYAN